MTLRSCDLFVIGGGSGGVRAANVAAGLGATVELAESHDLGGTCVNRGCVPKKLLVVASRYGEDIRAARSHGWTVGEASVDWPRLMADVESVRARISGSYRGKLVQSGVRLHASRARLFDAHTVQLEATGEKVRAKKILIATGGRPQRPESLPGAEHLLVSDDMFRLPELPRRVVVFGGGYIAVEFASLLRSFGCAVTVLVREHRLLKKFDSDLGKHLQAAMRMRGVDVRFGIEVAAIRREGETRVVELKDGSRVEADQVLAAIGRMPNIEGLGLDAAGVTLGEKGEIVVDALSRSSVPHIFAIGDVTKRVELTPVAIREAQAFAESEFGKARHGFDHALIPSAVFTTPEVITVGLSEDEARKRELRVKIYCADFLPLRLALTSDPTRVFIKLVVDADSDRVLGAHAVGVEVAEWLQFLDMLLRMGATKAQFDASVAVHPTMSEEFVTLKLAE